MHKRPVSPFVRCRNPMIIFGGKVCKNTFSIWNVHLSFMFSQRNTETFTAFLRKPNFLCNKIHKRVRPHVQETLVCSEGERTSYHNSSELFREGWRPSLFLRLTKHDELTSLKVCLDLSWRGDVWRLSVLLLHNIDLWHRNAWRRVWCKASSAASCATTRPVSNGLSAASSKSWPPATCSNMRGSSRILRCTCGYKLASGRWTWKYHKNWIFAMSYIMTVVGLKATAAPVLILFSSLGSAECKLHRSWNCNTLDTLPKSKGTPKHICPCRSLDLTILTFQSF